MQQEALPQEVYETPDVVELGDVDALTLGPFGGNFPDGGEDLFFRFFWPF